MLQCRAELEGDRQQLQTQLDTLRQQLADQSRHAAESRDRCDVTEHALEEEDTGGRLVAAEQTAARYRHALRLKVVN